MAETHAWILSLTPHVRLAVADREMIEFIMEPSVEKVPLTPEHCSEVLIHRDELLPLFDLNHLLGYEALSHRRYAGMLAYQDAAKQPLKHLAIYLYGPPARLKVNDDWITDIPPEFSGARRRLALSCFKLGDYTVPILNVPALGSAALLQDLLSERGEAVGSPATPEAAG